MKLEIKKPPKEDKGAFIELALELTKFNQRQHILHYDNFDDVMAIRAERVAGTFDTFAQKDHRLLLLAYIDRTPVGYVKAYIHDHKLRIGYLDELYVKESARGSGVGKKLLDRVTKWMKEKRLVRMMLCVYLWNDVARDFYEREGFKDYAVSYEKNLLH